MRNSLRTLFVVIMAVVLVSCQTSVTSLSKGQSGSLFYTGSTGITLSGALKLPENVSGKVPAMILVHGSGGLGYRQSSWGSYLRDHGLATMTIDYFSPRGHAPGSGNPPSPAIDITDAMKLLITHPKIDPERIGVIGWSNGANMSIGSSGLDASYSGGHALKAHVAIYPTCQHMGIGSGGSGAPILVLIGTEDSYTEPRFCEILVDGGVKRERDVRLIVYDGAYHGWDGDYSGSFSYRSYGVVTMKPDWKITEISRRDVMKFLRRTLKLGS